MKQVISRFKESSIFHSWQTIWLAVFYFFIRLLSFSLYEQIWLQSILAGLVFVVFTFYYFKNPRWCWFILLAELLLAGSGLYLKFISIPIRAIVFVSFLFLIGLHQLGEQYLSNNIKANKKITAVLCIIFFLTTISLLIGLTSGYGQSALVGALPVAYLFLFFAAYHLFKTERDIERLIRVIVVFVVCSAIFSLFISLSFSLGIFELQDQFYSWFKEINLGQIINTSGFHRIIAPYQIIFTPIALVISSLLMRDEKHHHMWRVLLFSCLLVITINFSPIQFLALLVGYLVLLYKHKFTRWVKVTLASLGQLIVIFLGLNLIATGGVYSSVEMIGNQINNFLVNLEGVIQLTQNSTAEISLIGSGLGAIESSSGYLNLIVEFGVLGTIFLLGSFFSLIILTIKKLNDFNDYLDLHVGLLSGLVSLLVLNITKPAFFNLYSILFIIFMLVIVSKTHNIFGEAIHAIYRVFHKESPL